ncbi:hypothetical protein TA3x_000400 [Tundrisphaera sp. TA3]|uniref:hypothetical protein n=1 Tax=Tundrisphaera sp. TA3 TaxID=3435775 RepID=UPI003EB768C1
MTGLPDIALDFARSCIGWEDCDIGATKPLIVGPQESFAYTDLRAVLEAASRWVAFKAESVGIHSYEGGFFIGVVIAYGVTLGSTVSSCPCEALMGACLAAAKVLDAQGAGV